MPCIGRIERTRNPSKRGTRENGSKSAVHAVRHQKRFDLWYERLTIVRAVSTVIVVALVLVLLAGALASA